MAREAFQAFFDADEVGQVADSFGKMLELAELDYQSSGKEIFERLREVFEGKVSFRLKKIFTILADAMAKKDALTQAESADMKVFISGAGPCGLRTAIECALLGFKTTIVEKRGTFSRANILMLWSHTKDDLVSLGSKFFYKDMLTHGHPLHLGTREIQLCLLKSALLLGVEVFYETSLMGFLYDTKEQIWKAQVKDSSKAKAEEASGLKKALEFKPSKLGDYRTTYKCNLVDDAEMDESFVTKQIPGAKLIPFNACVIAEGEWSQSCRSLGFRKTVDRFKQALGVVINFEFDKSNKEESKMASFSMGSLNARGKILKDLESQGIYCENVEYLKGRTHYIATTVTKDTLLTTGTLKENLPSDKLLTPENLDIEKLQELARKIAQIIGLPASTKFYRTNPVQIFDFSSRARARNPAKYLTTESTKGTPTVITELPESVFELDSKPLADRAHIAPIFPVGDALLEPFWPQGLGSNRGFHGCLDVSHSILMLLRHGFKRQVTERDLAFNGMLALSWSKPKYVLNPYNFWTTDFLTRYTPLALKTAVGLVTRASRPLPERFGDMKVILEMEKALRAGRGASDQIYQ